MTIVLAGAAWCRLSAQEAEVRPLNTGAAGFLTLPADARSAAMAGTGIALPASPQAVFHNGAATAGSEGPDHGFGYTYSPWMRSYASGYSLHTASGYWRLDSRQAVMGGFRYYGCPELTMADTKLAPREWAAEVGYAYRLLDGLSVAATARYVRSDMGGGMAAGTVAFDVSAFYRHSLPLLPDAEWSVGVRASNMGARLKYGASKADLPSQLAAGGAVTLPFMLLHKLTLTADVCFRMQPTDVQAVSVSAGAEYTLLDVLHLRGGYHYGDKQKADYSYGSAGAGLSLYGARLDFGILFADKECPFRNTWSVSAGFCF